MLLTIVIEIILVINWRVPYNMRYSNKPRSELLGKVYKPRD